MIIDYNLCSISELNLTHIGKHKRAFEIEDYLFPLEQFEKLVQVQTDAMIDCACKIDHDTLHAARFTLTWKKPCAKSQINAALDFFNAVAARVEVKLNYQLLHQFLGNDFDFSKVTKILVGVDARREIKDSRLKLFIWIENYLEKIETAISLSGDSPELRSMLINNNLLIGFDFSLNVGNGIELYPTIPAEEFNRADVQMRLAKILPPKALELLKGCYTLQIGFSQANESKILYFHPTDHNYFVDNLGNHLANRVHAYYRHQAVQALVVCIPESELLKSSIQKLNMYYGMISSLTLAPSIGL
ncbi:MAG: LynF/TruF/PatF family peptide O-prenyltransferase [Trichormus sp.]